MKQVIFLAVLVLALVGCNTPSTEERQVSRIQKLFQNATNVTISGREVTFDLVVDGKKRRMLYSNYWDSDSSVLVCLEGCNGGNYE